MAQEIWKPVVGYEGFYEVSDLGRIRALVRIVKHPRGGTRRYPGKILEPHEDRYLKVGLSKHGKAMTRRVHQLVMLAFVGPCPTGMQVCHSDGINHNCALSNLYYGTPKRNCQDRSAHGKTARGTKNHKAVLDEMKVAELRSIYARGAATQREIATMFGVSQCTVWRTIKGKTWGWLNEKR